MKYLAAVLLFVSSLSHASLWELSFTGTAFLPNGTSGTETVVYRYDTDSIVFTDCPFFNEPCPGGIPGQLTAIGPILSVRYFGLVNGFGGPTVLFVHVGSGEPDISHRFGGTTTTTFCCIQQWKNPTPLSGDTLRSFGIADWFGGEDGWNWHAGPFVALTPEQWLGHFSLLPVAVGVGEPNALLLVLGALALACTASAGAERLLPSGLRRPRCGLATRSRQPRANSQAVGRQL
jgi:hypothetical protein